METPPGTGLTTLAATAGNLPTNPNGRRLIRSTLPNPPPRNALTGTAMTAAASARTTMATTGTPATTMMRGMTTQTTTTTGAATTDTRRASWRASIVERMGLARRSLRGRILVPFVTVLALTTLASVFIQRQVLLRQLDERINADLAQEVTELQQLVGGPDGDGGCVAGRDSQGRCIVGRDPTTGQPFGSDIRAVFDTFLRRNIPSDFETMITFVDGAPYKVPAVRLPYAGDADDVLYELAELKRPQRGEAATPNGTIRYMAVPVRTPDGSGSGVFAVAQFVDLQRAQVEEVLRLMTGTELILLLTASGLAYLLAGRLLAPVRDVTETAQQISETDLSRRIEVEGDDEAANLARTFNQMLDRLQTAFVAQRNFVDDAGHELRTPITIIRGNLELLSDDPAEQAEAVAVMTDELDRMNRMVDDLLLLARLERPDFLTLDVVDVHQLTEELVVKASALGQRDWGVDAVGAGRIVADSQRVTQAVMQLAQNATDHTNTGDAIWLGSDVADGYARFWVRDSGPGVSPGDAEKIFERFSRGSLTRRTDGAGLGLSIVRAIAEAHGGRVELRSAPSDGATFTVVLPVDAEGDPT